ncbi:response regulator transcription factor [Candidatus Aquiluna sp. UB-MaderosW2red]|uniref:response regulator transcription factor n=1 Tax=Candidatus Aquiluna sp. UB-MaderosW2red TaxID=1855377 RepID=UPI001560C4F6|nr:response regulator transcription factor [Candidatus Aquiluna sp. UB-MaderosW2red]
MKTYVRRVLIVEDEVLIRNFLCLTLEEAGFEVAQASSAAQALDVIKKFDPDIAILDINLGPGPSGVDLAFVMDKMQFGVALVVLTNHPDLRTAGYSKSDLPVGCGFLRKDLIDDPSAFIAAIETVIAGRKELRQDQDKSRPLAELSAHQIEILRLTASGLTNAAIAKQRNTSSRAVEQSLKGIYEVLGIDTDGDVNPRVEAATRFFRAAGLPNSSNS